MTFSLSRQTCDFSLARVSLAFEASARRTDWSATGRHNCAWTCCALRVSRHCTYNSTIGTNCGVSVHDTTICSYSTTRGYCAYWTGWTVSVNCSTRKDGSARRHCTYGTSWSISVDGSARRYDTTRRHCTYSSSWSISVDGSARRHDPTRRHCTNRSGWSISIHGSARRHDPTRRDCTNRSGWRISVNSTSNRRHYRWYRSDRTRRSISVHGAAAWRSNDCWSKWSCRYRSSSDHQRRRTG